MELFVDLKSVWGQCVGVPKLSMDVRVKHDLDDPARILHVTAEVRAAPTPQIYDFAKSSYFIGYAVLESDGGQIGPGQEHTWTFGLALTQYHLQKIEEIRNRSDLYLIGRFTCSAVQLDKADPSKLKALFSPRASRVGYSSDYCPFKIAQSDWMKILKDLGYGDYFLIEVPLRGIRSRKRMEKALGHLSKAWKHYGEGGDRETLASCYSAFEALAKEARFENPDQNAFEKLLDGVENRGKKDKLKAVMDYVCRFLQLGRHVQGREPSNLEHKDSEFGLILSQAALAYLAKSMSHPTQEGA